MLTLARTVNPLTYPGYRLPGFDPTHPASISGGAQGLPFSVISTGTATGNLITTGKAGTVVGAPTGAIVAGIGPATKFSAATDQNTWSGFANHASTPACSGAAIVMHTSLPANGVVATYICSSNASGSGVFIASQGAVSTTTPALILGGGSSFVATTLLVLVNIPYFIAMSFPGGTTTTIVNFVLVNLLTGGVQTAVVTATTPTGGASSSGVRTVGNRNGSQQTLGYIAAGMFTTVYLPMATLRQWAADPWSFWYPPAIEELIFDSLVAQAAPVAAIPLMGQIWM